MARLPKVGEKNWGGILNSYLLVSHASDGKLRTVSVAKGGTGATTASEARANIGAAYKNDSRFTNERTPADGSVTDDKISSSGLSPSSIAGTAVISSDSRLTNSRTPSDGSVTDAKISSTLSQSKITNLTSDLSTLSSSISSKATDASVVHISGTETVTGSKNFTGGLSAYGQFVVTDDDSRLTNTRTPTDASVTPNKLKASASVNQIPVATGTSGWNWVRPAIYLEAYGAVGDGVTNDYSAFLAALTAAPAGSTIIGDGSKTYLLGSTLVIGKSITFDLQGATIKKSADGTYYALSVSSADPVTLKNIVIDGNRNNTGSPQGLEGILFGSAATVLHKAINCTSGSNGKSGFKVDGGASQVVEFYDCYSYNNYDAVNENNAHGFIVSAGIGKFYDCLAEENGGSGFYITASAYAGCEFWNCVSRRNTLAGFDIRRGSIGDASSSLTNGNWGRAHSIFADENRNYGVFLNSSYWHITSAVTNLTGTAANGNYVDGTGTLSSGSGFVIGGIVANDLSHTISFYANRNKIGSILSTRNQGYGLALSAATNNDIGSVICDGLDSGDGDPAIVIREGSSNNSISSASVRNYTFGLGIGDDDRQSSDENYVGSIYVYQCTYGAVAILYGAYNHIGKVISRDSGTTSITYTGLINFSTTHTTDNLIDYVDHKMITGSVATKPKYIVHADADAVRNKVVAGKTKTSEAQTGLYSDQNGGNFIGPLVLPTSKAASSISPGASPYAYQNVDGYNQKVIVQGGTVSKIEISPDGSVYTDLGVISGMFDVDYGDYLKVTYSVAPTMSKKPV